MLAKKNEFTIGFATNAIPDIRHLVKRIFHITSSQTSRLDTVVESKKLHNQSSVSIPLPSNPICPSLQAQVANLEVRSWTRRMYLPPSTPPNALPFPSAASVHRPAFYSSFAATVLFLRNWLRYLPIPFFSPNFVRASTLLCRAMTYSRIIPASNKDSTRAHNLPSLTPEPCYSPFFSCIVAILSSLFFPGP